MDFTGDWRRPSDGVIYSLSQSGCKVTGGLGGHSVIMIANGNTAFGNIHRTLGGCTTIVTARITKLSSDQIRIDWLGTDGKCDLGAGFTESYVYDKL